jgi:hypothetical protein
MRRNGKATCPHSPPLTLRNVNSQHDLLLYPWHQIGSHPILACSYFLNPVR